MEYSTQNDRFALPLPAGTLRLSDRTHIMGILNVTPDSFYDGGQFRDVNAAVEQGKHMAKEGADIIDIGGESTRPGSEGASAEEELNRVIPVIEKLAGSVSIPLSIDTQKSTVAEKALEAGCSIVNDISGLRADPRMAEVATSYNAAVIVMHIQGTPRTMQSDPHYEDLMAEISLYLRDSAAKALEAGIPQDKIVVDPGIGFGKTAEHNLQILKHLNQLKSLGYPILIGTSRKSTIGAVLDLPTEQRIYGTAATVAAAVFHGAHIIRVHDVKEMLQVAKMCDAIMKAA